MYFAMSHWSGLRSLASVTPSILDVTRTPPNYSVVALCHEVPAALDQQDQLFHMTQLFTVDVDFGADQLKALALGSFIQTPGRALQYCSS